MSRSGRQRVVLALRPSGTAIVEQETAFPAGSIRASHVDGDGVAEVQLTNPSGGLLAGDELVTEVVAEAGTLSSFVTQGAQRVYPGVQVRLSTCVEVRAGAAVEWIPHHLVPHTGSSLHQRTVFDVAAGGVLLAWECVSAGREALGERFAWDRLDSRLQVRLDGAPLVADGMLLSAHAPSALAHSPFDGASFLATAVLVLPTGSDAKALSDSFDAELSAVRGSLGSASAIGEQAVAVRVLSRDAPSLYASLEPVRRLGREAIGLPPASRNIS